MHLPIAGLVLATACLYGADASLRMHKRVYEYPSHVPVHSGSFIVEFEDHQVHTHAENLNALSSVSVHKRFTKGFHGAVIATSKDLNPEMLAQVPGVKRIWRNRKHSLTTRKGKREITSPFLHQMTGVAQAMQEFGLDGTGVKIGIIDTGVDYNHPEFGACWKTEGCPWQLGKDFIGDKYDPSSENPIIEPNDTPTDCYGHGTHVSGIIGARGPHVQGIAPGATLGMYRAFSCPVNGTLHTDDSIIMQGMVAAHEDGCDIINVSLGAGGWPEDPIAVLATKLVDEGVFVIAANGNEGNNGLHTSSSPSVGRGVIGVGSVDNWNFTSISTIFTTPDGDKVVQLSDTAANGLTFTFNASTPLIVPTGDANMYGCNKTNTDYSGSVVVVRRGECMYNDKAYFAQSQGAIGLVVVNNEPGLTAMSILPNITIPCIQISADDGEYVIKGITAGTSTVVTNVTEFALFDNPTGGQMSGFSSYGPTPELDLSPLISAPGGDIWSTYPIEMGSYTSMSGTSMATPYIAGCVALLKQKFPNMSVSQIRQMLINSASPISDSNTGLKINPYRSGAGLVNVYNALRTRVFIDPPYLSINQTELTQPSDTATDNENQGVRISTHMLNFTNTDLKKGVNVILTNDAASSLSLYDKDGKYAQSLLKSSIVPTWPKDTTPVPQNTIPQAIMPTEPQYVPAGQTMQFNVSIILPSGLAESERWYFGGFLNFTIMFDDEDYTMQHVVPYAGYNGDYNKIDIFSPPTTGLPAFIDSEANIVTDISTAKFDSANPKQIAFSIDVPTSFIYAAYIDAGNKIVGYLAGGSAVYIPRNLPSASPVYTTTVNNTILAGDDFSKTAILPNGKYRVRLAVLRPFGNPDNNEDFQMWDSDEITFGG